MKVTFGNGAPRSRSKIVISVAGLMPTSPSVYEGIYSKDNFAFRYIRKVSSLVGGIGTFLTAAIASSKGIGGS